MLALLPGLSRIGFDERTIGILRPHNFPICCILPVLSTFAGTVSFRGTRKQVAQVDITSVSL